MRKPPIEPGDRFVKIEDRRTVWVVDRVVETVGRLPHVQLVQEARPHRRRTLSESILRDRNFYARLGPV
ncbi:MAG: hypothetical protein KDE22_06085 [Rhodobacterales bacterium]|nr:hypothetical protein [Rhodobacterales bacterium]